MKIPEGGVTEAGVRTNISVGIQYLEAWLRGKGSVPLNSLMEDAATAEICRAQLWQWIRNGTKLSDGRTMSLEIFKTITDEELERIKGQIGGESQSRQFELSRELFSRMVSAKDFPEFLTLPAYEELLRLEKTAYPPRI